MDVDTLVDSQMYMGEQWDEYATYIRQQAEEFKYMEKEGKSKGKAGRKEQGEGWYSRPYRRYRKKSVALSEGTSFDPEEWSRRQLK